jgi:hypothetical protein
MFGNADWLRSNQVGTIELDEQRKQRNIISERWDKLGFTNGLTGALKENISTLYENQAKKILSEANSADQSGQFQTVVFPIIRRVFSKLLANDIVSVQAMNMPVGKIFFISPTTTVRTPNIPAGTPEGYIPDGSTFSHTGMMGYERTSRVLSSRTDAGQIEPRYYLPDEVVPTALTTAAPYGLSVNYQKSLYDMFYDDGLFDNSKGKITIASVKPTLVRLTASGYSATNTAGSAMTVADIEVSSIDNTVRKVILKVSGFSNYNTGKLTGPDGNEQDTEEFLASLKVITKAAISANTSGSAAFAQYAQFPVHIKPIKWGAGLVEYNSNVCNANGEMYIEIDTMVPTTSALTTDGYIGIDPAVNAHFVDNLEVAWCSYDSLELETEIGEVSFNMSSTTISVTERKLRATWSPELQQDISAFHNIDTEAELTSLLSEQISAEIDREILRDLRKAGAWSLRFDANGWKHLKGYSTNYTQKDWNQELFTTINQISAQIQKSTLLGAANFIVVSPEVSCLLNNLEYFHVTDASAESDKYSMGIERIGSLNNQLQVYVDSYSPSYSVIVGHKGNTLLETGYVYAPYIPLQLTPTLTNPFNFAPVKGIMTRYAKKLINNKYYGHVRVDGLVSWSTAEFR